LGEARFKVNGRTRIGQISKRQVAGMKLGLNPFINVIVVLNPINTNRDNIVFAQRAINYFIINPIGIFSAERHCHKTFQSHCFRNPVSREFLLLDYTNARLFPQEIEPISFFALPVL